MYIFTIHTHTCNKDHTITCMAVWLLDCVAIPELRLLVFIVSCYNDEILGLA
jgi:hypothetical protein